MTINKKFLRYLVTILTYIINAYQSKTVENSLEKQINHSQNRYLLPIRREAKYLFW